MSFGRTVLRAGVGSVPPQHSCLCEHWSVPNSEPRSPFAVTWGDALSVHIRSHSMSPRPGVSASARLQLTSSFRVGFPRVTVALRLGRLEGTRCHSASPGLTPSTSSDTARGDCRLTLREPQGGGSTPAKRQDKQTGHCWDGETVGIVGAVLLFPKFNITL